MTLRSLTRWAWFPFGAAIGAYFAAPWLLKRAFAPPQRDADHTPNDLGLPEQQVWLTGQNGKRLHGWFIPVEGHAPAVVIVHGWGGNAALMLPLAPHLYEAGFHALFLDARNHGHSDHDSFASMPRFAEDLEVAIDWLRARTEVASVGVIGHSVGAGAAIFSASRGANLDAVVSVSSPAHPGELMREQMAKVPGPLLTVMFEVMQRVIGFRFDAFAPRNQIGAVRVPIMLVHGSADEVVGIDNLEDLAAAHPGAEVLVVPGAGHSDLAPFEPYVANITGFLARALGQ
ncbi:MAG: alpha/beta hydrolase [Acidimicrobiia bacterium]|nr:alpha/beta hydrolase [Acidimicrobiia bacterium]